MAFTREMSGFLKDLDKHLAIAKKARLKLNGNLKLLSNPHAIIVSDGAKAAEKLAKCLNMMLERAHLEPVTEEDVCNSRS